MSTVVEREPDWLPDDIDAALDYIDDQALICSGCGQPRSESMDPKNARAYEAVPLTCYGCKARDEEHRLAAKTRNDYADDAFDGVFIVVEKKESA